MATSHTVSKIGTVTGIAIVVANMIGTGVFTSLGFQVADLHNPAVILTLWVLGGVIALAGAFSYAEIGTVIKKSGGEYTYLSDVFSPFIGYLAGWISLTVGFAAPVALSAIAVVSYFPYMDLHPVWASIAIVAAITVFHSISLRSSAVFQNTSTMLKVALVIALIILGLSNASAVEAAPAGENYVPELFSSAFFIALIYVSYSYSGWNAAAYITEELKRPRRSLPVALLVGTTIVVILYTLLQLIFLKHVPVAELAGQVDVGAIAANKILGTNAGNVFSLAISVLLISGLSAMIWVGPRVTSSMARDHRLWRYFRSRDNKIPVRAIWLQFIITAAMLVTGTFDQILIYCGFLLTLSTMLTVLGIFVIRRSHREKYSGTSVYRSPLFPLLQIIFIAFSLGILVFTFVEKPVEAILGTTNLLVGGLTWHINTLITKPSTD